ncbi:MAG: hypothetical protein OSA97_13430 [Nevskia sp.]|nr:hypothetical protein [Nevskia sp.]
MGEEHILPGEFMALVFFWWGPPMVLAWAAQGWYLARRGMIRRHAVRCVGVVVATGVISVVGGIALLVVSPVLMVAPLVTWWGVRGVRNVA